MAWDKWTAYEESLYRYDRESKDCNAEVLPGAYLYRITSLSHCSHSDVLSGRGTLAVPGYGRFHAPHQPTSYCSNNVLVCLSEMLFHMYHTTLKRIDDGFHAADIRSGMSTIRCMTVLRVNSEIGDLVYLDSDGVTYDYDRRLRGAVVVYPQAEYKVFQEFNNLVRSKKKRGILYPSARHSRDVCLALFNDETAFIDDRFPVITLKLQLVKEDQDFTTPVEKCDPILHKMHPTMGYFEIDNADKRVFERLVASEVIHPAGMPVKGMVDFVRRRYRVYPTGAVCSLVGPAASTPIVSI